MKYFIDTEFIEGFKKPLFGKRRHFIDLISIGIVTEDGGYFYMVSNEYNYNDANDWVKENVILPLYKQLVVGDQRNRYSVETFHKYLGSSNKHIASEIYRFICPYQYASDCADIGGIDEGGEQYLKSNPPEFYGYYADYDWVLFCSLFGRMIDLPNGFPMYCRDLKQMLDERADALIFSKRHEFGVLDCYTDTKEGLKPSKIFTSQERIEAIKNSPNYPKQSNEHNALDDAKWNKELYNFILQL